MKMPITVVWTVIAEFRHVLSLREEWCYFYADRFRRLRMHVVSVKVDVTGGIMYGTSLFLASVPYNSVSNQVHRVC